VAAAYCPRCGNARIGSSRFCASCGLDFETITPAGTLGSPDPGRGFPAGNGWVVPPTTPERPLGPFAWIGAALFGVGVYLGASIALAIVLPTAGSGTVGWMGVIAGMIAAGLSIGAKTVKRWAAICALTFVFIFLIAAVLYVLSGQTS
jgi:hypothetical protein